MKRKITDELMEWKNRKTLRIPLVLYGARQVGKTFAVKEFGEQNYDDVVYANFDADVNLRPYFERDLHPSNIIITLEEYFQTKIHPRKTLIIFDEIQECPRALTSLKYFAEEASDFDIIAAGSLLGVAVKSGFNGEDNGTSFPVGKVDIKTMYPLDFEEFLWANGKNILVTEIRTGYESNSALVSGLHEQALELYRNYIVVGGMPLAVKSYVDGIENPSFQDIQKLINSAYTADMTKYCNATQGIRNISLYNSIPSQLGNMDKPNNKFVYSAVEKGARKANYKDSIEWLQTAGVALKCTRTSRGDVPPKQYQDVDSFKMYYGDVGLLCQALHVNRENWEAFNQMYRGTITENYFAQQLTSNGHELFFWETSGKLNSEVDFVTIVNDKVIPIEVKSGNNTKAKSLNSFITKYRPDYAIRVSTKNFGFENNIKSIPLYAAFLV